MENFIIKAGEAFGSGAHPSTRLAVAAMEVVTLPPLPLGEGWGEGKHNIENSPHPALRATLSQGEREYRILDMGCGSGVLALVAAGMWPRARILACDIEPAAVEATQENAAANGCADRLTAFRSDGYKAPEITTHGPYDLILCNMLAEPLTRMAGDAARHLAPGGMLILSGILAWLLEPVKIAHAAAGLQHRHTLQLGDWRAMVVVME